MRQLTFKLQFVQICFMIHGLKARFLYTLVLRLLRMYISVLSSFFQCFCLILSTIKALCQHLPFTWKSSCLPWKLAIFIFSKQKGRLSLTESNVYREIILASGCFMKIVTVQLVWLFLWLKWAHCYDVTARAKTIIHLLRQTQD